MKILALEHENSSATAESFQRLGKAEARAVWHYYQNGIIRELYFRADQHTAVLVLECASTEEAENALACLPLVKEGLISFEIIPLTVYNGFSRLFAPEQQAQ